MALKRLKVCHFASVHTTTDTRVFARECVSLAKHHEVTLIAIGNNSGEHQGVHVVAIPKPASRIKRVLFTTWKVFFKAIRENADVYHIHDAELLPFAFLLSLTGKKVIYDLHENTYHDITHKAWIPKLLRNLLGGTYRAMESLSALTMHHILVIAQESFAKQFKSKQFTIVQNFADVESLLPYREINREQLTSNRLFYMGTLYDDYYNLDKVLEALAICKRNGLMIEFDVAGYVGNFIETRVSKLDYWNEIKDNVHFYGYLSMQDGYKLSMKCKAGICLKDQPEQILVSHERKFFEYMAVGLPSICCDSKIYTDIIHQYQNGIAVDLNNAEAIAEALMRIFQSNQLNTYQQGAVKAAEEHYNWKSQENILLHLYQTI